MAYPFIKFPTFSEFRQILESEFNCEYKQLDQMSFEDPQGVKHPIYYFERKHESETYLAAIDVPNGAIVQLSLLRSVCARLHIRVERFGLHLDYTE
jgi:hypothetical protein